jgi:DNA-3-methyladenine glycosylase II
MVRERLRPVVAERSPSDLRAAWPAWENEGGAIDEWPIDLSRGTITIEPVLPFRLDLTVWALRRRPRNAIDRWDGTSYRRALALADEPVGFSATPAGGLDVPYLAVALTGPDMSRRVEEGVGSSIERMLGLRVDLSTFYELAETDSLIRSLVARFRGLKPPLLPTVFESLLNAVACQQLSLEAGLSLLNRLADAHGQGVSIDGTSLHAFPRPSDLAALDPQSLRTLGFSLRKATTIVELSRAVVAGRLDLEGLERLADDEIVARLTSLPGIGRWSAEYVLLRGLGRLHVFPGDDVGARNNLARWLGLEPTLDYDEVGRAVSCWQPYAGMVYFHLLLHGLETAGELDAGQELRR